MTAPLKFLAGFLSNALTQSVRCMWNTTNFLVQILIFLVCVVLATFQFAGGGSERSKKTFHAGLLALKTSLKCCTFAIFQALGVLTCASPLMRASQACTETIKPRGLFMPCEPNRNFVQKILGLNSWAETPVELPPQEMKLVRLEEKPKKRSTKAQAKTKDKPKRADVDANSWEALVKRYLDAQTIQESDRIRNEMAVKHTMRYLKALAVARKPRSKKAA